MFLTESIVHARGKVKEGKAREAVLQLEGVRRRAAEIREACDPAALGLPDLLFPQGAVQGEPQQREGVWRYSRPVAWPEQTVDYERRRNLAVRNVAESYLIVEKDDGERRPVILFEKANDVVADVFYGRARFVVIWAARGSGKSLAIGVLLFLLIAYRARSVLDVAGSQDQALQVFQYVMSFIRSVSKVGEKFLIKPLRDRASFANGATILCVAASEKAVRGKHKPVLVIDEACQDEGDAGETSKVMRSALQGPLSEPDSIALAFSTWHAVSDFFEELWNKAAERGFVRYSWDCVLPGTWILTGRGFQLVEDIVAGDTVMAEDGTFRKVDRAWSKITSKDAVRIVPYGWSEGFEVTADHLLLTDSGWVKAEDIAPGDSLQFPLPASVEGEVSWDLSWQDGRRAAGELTREAVEISPDFCRFLGLWLGDGSLDGRAVVVSFGHPDKFQDIYLALVTRLFGREVYVDREEPNQRGRFTHPGLAEVLRGWGYEDGHKHLSQDFVLGLEEDCLRGLVEGLLLSDGYAPSLRAAALSFVQVSPTVSQAFYLALVRLGYHPSLDRRRQRPSFYEGRRIDGSDYWTVRLNGDDAREVGSWIGTASPPVRVAKPARWSREGSTYLTEVRKVERRDYGGRVFDLAVAGVHSFALPWAVAHNCYDVMARCTQGLKDPAGGEYYPTHPEAVRACESCFLTETENIVDPHSGAIVGTKRVGCFNEELGHGRARHSDGWQNFEATCSQKRTNLGTDRFAVEFENRRPTKGDPIYNSFQVDGARSDHEFQIFVSHDWPSVFGVDWGWSSGNCAIIHVLPYGELVSGMGVPVIHGLVAVQECYMGQVNHTHVATEMKRMEREAGLPEGRSEVFGDSRQPADNLGLHEMGWVVRGVDFQVVKEAIITNIGLYLTFGRFKMVAGRTSTLHNQLGRYHRDGKRKPVKKDDHGCDAVGAAMFRFPFIKKFPLE